MLAQDYLWALWETVTGLTGTKEARSTLKQEIEQEDDLLALESIR
jgi:hypothetical protein